MNKKHYISSDLLHLPSFPFLKSFYKKLLKLDSFKILSPEGEESLKSIRDELNLSPDKIIKSVDDSEISLICCQNSDFIKSAYNNIIVLLHPLDITNLSDAIEKSIKLNANTILSEILPDEIKDNIDLKLTSFYSQHFKHLSSYQIIDEHSPQKQKSKQEQLIIYDKVDHLNSHKIKIQEMSFSILAEQSEIEVIRFDLLNLENPDLLIEKVINYDCVHLFINNPINESFVASILNANAVPFYSVNSNLSPIRFLWNVSQQDKLPSIFNKNDSLRSILQNIINIAKTKVDRLIENEQMIYYSAESQINSIFSNLEIKRQDPNISLNAFIQGIYAIKKPFLFSFYESAGLDNATNNVPQWIKNPSMGQIYISLVNYALKHAEKNPFKVLLDKLNEFLKKYPGSLSRIAMQPFIPWVVNLYNKKLDLPQVTPAIESLIFHDINQGTAQHDAILILYAAMHRNGKTDLAKAILSRVVQNKMNSVALPAILLYSWIYDISTDIDFPDISKSLDEKIFQQYPERYLTLIIIYLLNGLSNKAEDAFKYLNVRNPKMFVNEIHGEHPLCHWFLMSICYKLNNNNDEANLYLKKAISINEQRLHIYDHLLKKVDDLNQKSHSTIKIPDFITDL